MTKSMIIGEGRMVGGVMHVFDGIALVKARGAKPIWEPQKFGYISDDGSIALIGEPVEGENPHAHLNNDALALEATLPERVYRITSPAENRDARLWIETGSTLAFDVALQSIVKTKTYARRPAAQVRDALTRVADRTAASLLRPTNFYAIRRIETGRAPPASVQAFRTAVHAVAGRVEKLIASITADEKADEAVAAIDAIEWPSADDVRDSQPEA